MSLPQLSEAILKASKALSEQEKLPVPVLAVRAKKLAEANPYDQTAIGMYNFLSKRADSEIFISKSDLKLAYQKLYTSNNVFAQAFKEELGGTQLPTPQKMVHSESENQDFLASQADLDLTNALSSILDPTQEVKTYNSETAISAEKACYHELARYALAPKTIKVMAGQVDLLICQATYETPKGEKQLIVPVEIREKRALLPTMFLADDGLTDLNKVALEKYLKNSLEIKSSVNLQKLLTTLSDIKNGKTSPVNEVEQLLLKKKASAGTPAYDSNSIIGQNINKENLNVELPTFQVSEEIQSFADNLSSAKGEAEFIFGKNIVQLGQNLISQDLKSFGYSQVQVKVASSTQKSIVYAASIDGKTGFKVPVKIENNKAVAPKAIICNKNVYSFNANGVAQLVSENQDLNIVAYTSPLYNTKGSELVDLLKTAMLDNDYSKAEEILIVLKSTDEKSYKVAFNTYQQGLTGNLQLANKVSASQCSLQIKHASSQHVICGHTNLPLNKVYQDKHGNCSPLYRQGMDNSYEGASFMSSKVLLG